MTNLETAKTMLNAFDSILCERMYETEKKIILDAINNSVSPVIRIVNSKTSITINRNDCKQENVIRFIIENMDDNTSVIVDGIDVLYWD